MQALCSHNYFTSTVQKTGAFDLWSDHIHQMPELKYIRTNAE